MTAYVAQFMASRPGSTYVHDADLAMIASTVVGVIDAHCAVDHGSLQASLVTDSIVSVVVPFQAQSDEDAAAITEQAVGSVWGWIVECGVSRMGEP